MLCYCKWKQQRIKVKTIIALVFTDSNIHDVHHWIQWILIKKSIRRNRKWKGKEGEEKGGIEKSRVE